MPNSQYADLQLTNFPDNIDTFITYLDILASDGRLVQLYMNAMNEGNQAQANEYLAQIPAAEQKIIKATDLNKITQAILALERFYKTDIQPYVENKQQEWLEVLSHFSYVGAWSSGTAYRKNNMVTYIVNGVELLYVATTENTPIGTSPLNGNYWRLLTLQGQQGVSGSGLSYRQVWKASEAYNKDDAVTYGGAVYVALKSNTAVQPDADASTWQKLISLNATTYPIQDTQPIGQPERGLWFNTSVEKTKYYELPALTNPATAQQIASGYEAYDANGNKIVGALVTPSMQQILEENEKLQADLDYLTVLTGVQV